MHRAALRIAVVLAALAAALPAWATFHLWTIEEIYSTADGRIQYIEFRALAAGQEFLSGHTLTASGGTGAARSYTFTRDLPADSAGHRFLVGTTSFAALGIVTPDYVVPDGFLTPGGGTINFASADIWSYPALPSGTLSLNRDGTTATGSPRNFAGASGTLGGSGTDFNVQGMWLRAPFGSEPGWGLSFAHQGDILFVGWFTYGSDGNGVWMYMPAARRTGPNAYAGDIMRSTGASFEVQPYDASRFNAVKVGTGTLTFTDSQNGTFAYTVNNNSRSLPITRWVYASPVSVCTIPAADDSSPLPYPP